VGNLGRVVVAVAVAAVVALGSLARETAAARQEKARAKMFGPDTTIITGTLGNGEILDVPYVSLSSTKIPVPFATDISTLTLLSYLLGPGLKTVRHLAPENQARVVVEALASLARVAAIALESLARVVLLQKVPAQAKECGLVTVTGTLAGILRHGRLP